MRDKTDKYDVKVLMDRNDAVDLFHLLGDIAAELQYKSDRTLDVHARLCDELRTKLETLLLSPPAEISRINEQCVDINEQGVNEDYEAARADQP